MLKDAEIFESHYEDYCRQISRCDFQAAADILKIRQEGDGVNIPFLQRNYRVSGNGIEDESGQRPPYGLCVILAKYLILCPPRVYEDTQWAAFKDFKKDASFTNVNFFTSDTEMAISNHFSGNCQALRRACERLGGRQEETGITYDVSMAVEVLPRICLLVLFNDRDEEFPPECRVLFQKHSEFYLDPESLIMTSTGLARQLIRTAKEVDG